MIPTHSLGLIRTGDGYCLRTAWDSSQPEMPGAHVSCQVFVGILCFEDVTERRNGSDEDAGYLEKAGRPMNNGGVGIKYQAEW